MANQVGGRVYLRVCLRARYVLQPPLLKKDKVQHLGDAAPAMASAQQAPSAAHAPAMQHEAVVAEEPPSHPGPVSQWPGIKGKEWTMDHDVNSKRCHG